MLFDVDGDFKKYQVFLDGTHQNLSKVKVEIDAASVFTSNKKRDDHLKSPDFFDVKNHKMITFVSDSIQKSGDNVTINGTLTILGKAKQVAIPFKVNKAEMGGKTTYVYRGKTQVDRSDFGVGADSVAAKISLKNQVDLDFLLVATP
jgi:polyisoprenoid-binding protein YceI